MMPNNRVIIPPREFVASFDVHAQKTFTSLCANELPVPEGEQIVDELNAQALRAAKRIGSKEAHNAHAVWVATAEHPVLSTIAGEEVDVAWPPHAMPGTNGFELLDGLPEITDYDYFVWEGIELDMHPYGACYHDLHEKLSTGVIEYLHSRHILAVIVGGLATDYCVKITALQLLRANFKVYINLAACRALSVETEQQAIKIMREQGAVMVENAACLCNKS